MPTGDEWRAAMREARAKLAAKQRTQRGRYRSRGPYDGRYLGIRKDPGKGKDDAETVDPQGG